MDKIIFEWEITSQEAKNRTLQSIPVVVSVLSGLALIVAIKERSWTVFAVFVVLMIVFYFLALAFSKFKARKFQIGDSGIYISKGSKQKTYTWDDFEYFFTYSLVINKNLSGVRNLRTKAMSQEIINTQDKLANINGEAYFLKKKQKTFLDKLVKTFVVVYSEPDNSTQVEEALATHLPHRPFEISTEAGITRYEFK